jgi:hypothetical protein
MTTAPSRTTPSAIASEASVRYPCRSYRQAEAFRDSLRRARTADDVRALMATAIWAPRDMVFDIALYASAFDQPLVDLVLTAGHMDSLARRFVVCDPAVAPFVASWVNREIGALEPAKPDTVWRGLRPLDRAGMAPAMDAIVDFACRRLSGDLSRGSEPSAMFEYFADAPLTEAHLLQLLKALRPDARDGTERWCHALATHRSVGGAMARALWIADAARQEFEWTAACNQSRHAEPYATQLDSERSRAQHALLMNPNIWSSATARDLAADPRLTEQWQRAVDARSAPTAWLAMFRVVAQVRADAACTMFAELPAEAECAVVAAGLSADDLVPVLASSSHALRTRAIMLTRGVPATHAHKRTARQ